MKLLLTILTMINKGSILFQIKAVFMCSIVLSPLTWLITKLTDWQLANSSYVSFVLGAIAIDHLLGTVYHAFYLRDFSMKKNVSGLLVKLMLVVCMGYLFEGLDSLMIEESILKDYTVMVLRLMVFLYPAGSAFANSYEMTGRKFPPVGFMEKLKQFSKSATINSNSDAKDV